MPGSKTWRILKLCPHLQKSKIMHPPKNQREMLVTLSARDQGEAQFCYPKANLSSTLKLGCPSRKNAQIFDVFCSQARTEKLISGCSFVNNVSWNPCKFAVEKLLFFSVSVVSVICLCSNNVWSCFQHDIINKLFISLNELRFCMYNWWDLNTWPQVSLLCDIIIQCRKRNSHENGYTL